MPERVDIEKWCSKACFGFRLAVCFAAFALFCIFYIPIVPVLNICLFFHAELFSHINRKATQICFRLLILISKFTGILSVHYCDSHKGEMSRILACNHISLLDVLLVIARYNDCFTFVNAKFFKNPLMRTIIRGSNYVVLDREGFYGKKESYEKAKSIIRRGGRMIIFPEGTRSIDGRLGHLEDGVFRMAAEIGTDITPIFVRSNRPFLNKTLSGFFCQGRVDFFLETLSPIRIDLKESLKVRARMAKLEFVERYEKWCING
ncbi:MAG: 1-acyl-sn-glycerol-3-phosphate acyltransferase [Oligoflexales bacterium]|nr:1-acyl-sn-glycerol-3-phosphate acyltransferase [Oligoflexales bacterium]